MDTGEIAQQIRQAIGAPGSWTLKLSQAAASGQLPLSAKDIACDDACSFGKWLHQLQSEPASAHPSYKSVLDAHAAFHRSAGAVAHKIEEGDMNAARALLDGAEYRAATRMLTAEMARWRANL